MGGILLLAGFLCCGVIAADALFRAHAGIVRAWLGLALGFIMMMWLPALAAFALDFTRAAQLVGLGAALCAAAGCQLSFRGKRAPFSCGMPLPVLLGALVPFFVLSAWLQYTHTLRPVDGALHVGQSTYGDLCLHLGIATSLQNAPFPPDYSILKSTLLGYPFLGDSMVTSMLLFGTDLAQGFIITGTIMMLIVYLGFLLFSWELTRSPGAVVVSFLLFFVNGGLGFMYTFDGVMKDPSALEAVFTGFYKTPTNQPDLNLRWVNVICDMMVPQRTLLTGWMALLPALYQLVTAVRTRGVRPFVILGLWGGAMCMIHTHSFLALGIISAAFMAHSLVRPGDMTRREHLTRYLCYGAIALVLAAPQLLTWSMPQTLGGGSLGFRFNWVNNRGDGRLIDGYFWFWIKNVGLPYIALVPAALSCPKGSRRRMLALGALAIYVIAETIQFQPNEYDNNKLFYVAYMVMTPALGCYAVELWQKLRGVRGRWLLAALTAAACLVSGSLSIAREVISDYQLFGASEVRAAAFIRQDTDPDAMFLTGQQHCNAVAALTGRYIVCGTGSYLYFHGLDYYAQQSAARSMLEAPAESEALFEQYGVDYVYISSHERTNFAVDEAWFSENLPCVFDDDDVRIYAVETSL